MPHLTGEGWIAHQRACARIVAFLDAWDRLGGYAVVPPGVGLGRQRGPATPDKGWTPLACDECGATWHGHIGEPCGWCEDRLDAQAADQARLDAAQARRQADLVPGWNWCPAHDHAWRGLPLEVCGAHGGPPSCNERGQPLRDPGHLQARKATA